jgi:DNA polymerase-3 subunit beta
MKFKAERVEFAEAVAWVRRTLPSRATRPVLANVHLQVAGDRLTLSASNDEWSSAVAVPVQALRDGVALAQGRLLDSVVRHLPHAAVDVDVDGDTLHLTCGSARFALRLLPSDDFPLLPEPDPGAATAVVKAEEFARTVARVARAASVDDNRPAWARGVLLESTPTALTATATDSYRLALRTMGWDEGTETSVLVPRRALEEAQHAAEQLGSDVRLQFEAAHVTFVFGDRRLRTTLIQERFPDYRALIPSGYERRLEVDRAELTEVVKRVSVVGDADAFPRVTLHLSADTARVTARSGEVGQADESLPATLEGDELEITFNARFLTEGLDALGTERVVLEFRDELKPAVLRPAPLAGDDQDAATEDVSEFLYLLMPVRL